GVLWFMYGDAHAGMSAGEDISGAGEYPDVLALHRQFWDLRRLGGWGARLAAGNFGGEKKQQIVVGRAEGSGAAAGRQIFQPDGPPLGDPITAYPGRYGGVAVTVGRFLP